jgi:hypothetical protein
MTPERRDDKVLPVARLCDDDPPVARPCGDEAAPVVHPVDEDEKPRRRRKRRPEHKPDLAILENIIPSPAILIAQIVALILVTGIGFLVTRGGIVWILGITVLGLAMLGLIALVTSSKERSPLQLVWHGGFVGLAFIIWLVVARPDRRAEVLIDNACGQDVVLEIDGREWAKCPNQKQWSAKVPRRKFVLVTRSAASGKELQRHENDATYGRKFLLNVLGANTYFRGTVHYVPEQMAGRRMLGGMPSDQPRETRDSWIDISDVDYLFNDKIPRRSRDLGGKKYLLRYRANLS